MGGSWSIPDGHSSLLISDYITHKHGCSFTPFQLIKMVFISHGRTLAYTGRPLIRDRIEAWDYGPVIPVLYHELKIWGGNKVRSLNYCGTNPEEDVDVGRNRTELFDSVINKTEREIIDVTVKHYGDWSFGDLQKLCHAPDSPWDKHYNSRMGVAIPDSTIKNYYKKELWRRA